jgi:tRNA A-37 threonylcarbamoyl transferase component Bud32
MNTSNPKFKTRFYNQLKVKNNDVFKTSSTSRIQKEYDWYLESSKYIPNNVPTVRLMESSNGQLSLRMNYIEGSNLFEYVRSKQVSDIEEIIESYFDLITRELHQGQVVSNPRDIKQMYLEKPSRSLEYFYEKYFSKRDFIIINSKVCKDPLKLLGEIYSDLEKKLLSTKFTFIHGDPTLSNIIIDKQNNLFCIDPRGGFGETKNYGDPRYDIAKLYYSLVGGFDFINNHEFKIFKDGNNFKYTILNPHQKDSESLFWKFFNTDKKIIKFIHSTIWLSLSPHLEESLDQTLAAFLNGTYLLNSLYD